MSGGDLKWCDHMCKMARLLLKTKHLSYHITHKLTSGCSIDQLKTCLCKTLYTNIYRGIIQSSQNVNNSNIYRLRNKEMGCSILIWQNTFYSYRNEALRHVTTTWMNLRNYLVWKKSVPSSYLSTWIIAFIWDINR